MKIQDLDIQIKRTQALIKDVRRLIKDRNISTGQLQIYCQLIQLAKLKIITLLQSIDDWLSVEYSQARYIPKDRNH